MVEKPYIFEKRLNRAFGAAKIVLGSRAIEKLLLALIGLPDSYEADKMPSVLSCITTLIDPSQQLVIHTGVDGTNKIDIKMEPNNLGSKVDGYTLVDISGAIESAIASDFTGLILELIQTHWKKELTLQDAENISFHLEKLINLLK